MPSDLIVRPCDVTTARVGVARLHRHLRAPPPSALAAWEIVRDGWPIGWCLVGRPGSRVLQARGWVEVTRVAVPEGARNACSMCYGAAARWARRQGHRILTYTRIDEPGASLRGAGWQLLAMPSDRLPGVVEAGQWSRPSRPRAQNERVDKVRWSPPWCVEEVIDAV